MRQTTGNLLQGQIFHQEHPFLQANQQQASQNQQAKHKANSKKNELTDSFISFEPLEKNNKGNPANRVTSDKADKTISYVIKMTTHPYRLGAESSSGNFKGKGFDTVIYRDENNWFNVGIGYFKSRSRANEVVLKLKKLKNFYGEIVAIKTKNPKKK